MARVRVELGRVSDRIRVDPGRVHGLVDGRRVHVPLAQLGEGLDQALVAALHTEHRVVLGVARPRVQSSSDDLLLGIGLGMGLGLRIGLGLELGKD